MNHRKPTILYITALTLLIPPILQAETISLEPAKDNTMFSEGDESNGKGIYLFAGRTNTPSNRRALLSFDLSGIPQGSTVESVSLSLNMNKTNFAVGAVSIAAHRLSRDWGEGASDAAAQEGRGTAAQAGDVTWNHAFYPDVNWATPGGEFSATASATIMVDGIGSYTWDGAGLVADVQSWVDDPSSNFGWILIGPENTTSAKRFASRENSTIANRPNLSVTYTTPVATWAGYTIEQDGRSVDTGEWLGIVDFANAPWIYSYSLSNYVYAPEENVAPEGGWIWAPR